MFCELPGGGGVGMDEVRAFFAALGPLSPEEEDAARPTLDDRERLLAFDGAVRRTCRIPGLVVAYP